MRSPIVVVLGLGLFGFASLVLGPTPALAVAALLVVGGIVQRHRATERDGRLVGGAAIATGASLAACAIFILAVIDHSQNTPVRLGPSSGFEVATTTSTPAPPP